MAAGAPDIGSLLAQIMGGGGGPAPGGPPGMAPGGPPQDGGGQEDAIQILRQIVDLCQQYLQVEPDEEDKLDGAKMLQFAQKLLAKDQQDRDSALGGSNVRMIRKAG